MPVSLSNLAILVSARPPDKPTAQRLLREHGFQHPASAHLAVQRLYQDDWQRRSLRKIFPHLMRASVASADPDRALLGFERLVAALPNPSMFYHYLEAAPARLDLLVKIFAHSQALAETLARNAEYFHFLIASDTLKAARTKAWLAAELARLLMPLRQPERKYAAIRGFRRRETLRIGARDLTGLAQVEETTLELSNLADVCLQAVFEIALESLRVQLKVPSAALVTTGRFAVIGMGKLGGQELNYSSDVDVIFVYDEEGQLTPALTNHQFYTKLAEEFVRVVGAKSDEGTIFRIDLRLRPEGSSGPLARSLESCENYYAEWGETWERMALIKSRCVAGDENVGAEFIRMVRPFVYARDAGVRVIQQMAAIKQRIETEIVRDDRLTRHVKLGVGGIREIEFIVQSFQVLHGGRNPALRNRSTLPTLPLLVRTGLLKESATRALAGAYRFLRNVEHRLQMEMELQTHTIPDEEQAQYRLARSLGFKSVTDFYKRQNSHTAAVRKIYQAVLTSAEESAAGSDGELVDTARLTTAVLRAGFKNGEAAVKIIETLLHGSGFVHVSQRTQELFQRLYPVILAISSKLADPDVALARFEKFVAAYGSRGLLYELLVRNSKLVEMLLRLGDASKFFSDILAQQPDLFDEVCRGVAIGETRGIDELTRELQAAQSAEIPLVETIRSWKRAEMLRIGIADVMEAVDVERVHLEMTRLAETCLGFALTESRRILKLKRLPFAVIGMGKFGGQELGYGADLDVLFVGGRNDADQTAASKLAAHVIDFMGRHTGGGKLFEVDARLRPDGADGPLASTVEAHRDYYARRAQLWERLALTKVRFVAGDAAAGANFMRMVHDYVYAQPVTTGQICEIRDMRRRIETERGRQDQVEWEFKTGPGGLIDVEFLIQTLQLKHGPAHASLRTAHTLAALNRLASLGLIEEEQTFQLRRHYLFLRRIESVLRRDENSNVASLPVGDLEQQQLARRLGFPEAKAFFDAYRHATARVRVLYERLMPGGGF